MSTKDSDGQQVMPFAAILNAIGNGTVAARLAEQLQELTQAVQETGKKGSLTLTLLVAPLKPGNVTNLITTARTVLKAPEDDSAAPSSVFFVDAAGNLTRDDPTQQTLPLRGLPTRSETA